MDQQVRYCRTSDGVDIAYAIQGEGPPLVIPPNLVISHLQLEMNTVIGSFYERLAERLTVVRYDARGTGMSQRDVIDFSPDAGERDLLAVVDRLQLDRFALYDHLLAGLGPAAVAANHPDRVTCMVWWVGQTIATVGSAARRLDALDGLMDTDWDLYCDVTGRLIRGWDSPDAAPFAEVMRRGTSPTTRRAAFAELERVRAGELGPLGEIRVPTLVAHLGTAQWPANAARTIAVEIPDAWVVSIPDHPQSTMPVGVDNPVLVGAIADFVEAAADPTSAVTAPILQLGSMRAILWTDVVGHTLIMDREGDERGRALLREHEQITRDHLATHGGTEVKAMGDGFMCWFSSAQAALECAIALQRAFASRNAAAEQPLHIRAGLNAGEPIAEDDDLFGISVIAAARICAQAEGGEIVVSDVVRQLVSGKGFTFEDRGAVDLKGFDEPVRLSTVQWQD